MTESAVGVSIGVAVTGVGAVIPRLAKAIKVVITRGDFVFLMVTR